MGKNKINILGTTYQLHFDLSDDKEKRLKTAWGITDFYTKDIFVDSKILKYDEDTTTKSLPEFKKKVLRHEILHAFLFESGLVENSKEQRAWAENEEMVDWFAIQSPKLFKIYKELDIL